MHRSLHHALASATFAALLASAGAPSSPELDKLRLSTCAARHGVIARNHEGQMVCREAKIRIEPYLAQHPELVPPAPGVTNRAPVYTPTTIGSLTIPAGTPAMDGGVPGAGVVQLTPPPPNPAPGAGTKAPMPAVPPVLQPPKPKTGTCYLRSCLRGNMKSACSCVEFNSNELCQFNETTPGGTCGNPQGFTTALCPAGYSCVNNRCRNDCQ